MKTLLSQDNKPQKLRKKLWAVEVIIFVICMLVAGASSAQDGTPPLLNNKDPFDDRINVPINETVTFGFNEPVAKGTGTIDLHDGSGLVESRDVANPAVTITGASIDPNFLTPLAAGKDYHVLISSGAFKDLAGNSYAGLSDPTIWNFSTQPIEINPPILGFLSPTNGEVDVSVSDVASGGIYFEFDETTIPGTGDFEIRRSSDDALIQSFALSDPDVEFEEDGVSIYNAVVPSNIEMYVMICSTCVTDTQGNPFPGTGPGDWSFTTGGAEVVSLSPADDATEIAVDQWVYQVNFDEDVQLNQFHSTRLIKLRDENDTEILSIDTNTEGVTTTDNVLTIDFNSAGEQEGFSLNENAMYYLEIPYDIVQDLSGNPFAGFTDADAWIFFTIDTEAPTVSSFSPADDVNDVAKDVGQLTITFSEDIQKTTGSLFLRRYAGNAEVQEFDVTTSQITVSGNTATLNNVTTLTPHISYWVQNFFGAFEDLAGNPLASWNDNETWDFTIRNEVPTNLQLSNTFIDENKAIGSNVGVLSSDDNDGDPPVYSLVAGTGDEDNASFSITGANLLSAEVFDAEMKTQYSIRVQVDDQSGGTVEEPYAITINNLDDVTPTITSFDPLNDATGISIDVATLTMTFSEDMMAGTGTLRLRNILGNAIIKEFDMGTADVVVSGNTVTLNNAPQLSYEQGYWIQNFNSGLDALKDLVGNELVAWNTNDVWNFTTEVKPDLTAPIITTINPMDNDQEVALAINLIIAFSEDVQKGSGDIHVKRVSDDFTIQTHSISSPAVTISGNTVTINPLDFPFATEMYIEMASGVFQDLAGNNFVGVVKPDWSFTTIKQDQTISFSQPESKTYGDLDFSLGVTSSSGLTIGYLSSNPAVATINDGTVTILGAGTTSITTSQSGNATYNPAPDVIQDLVVEKATLTATADDKAKTYGDANPGFSLSLTGFVNGDVSSVLDVLPPRSTSATTASDVGNYDIIVSGGSDNNYVYDYVNGTLNTTKALLTAAADDQSKIYGENNPGLPLSFTGFVNGDVSSVLDIVPSPSSIATSTSDVGTYAITVSGGTDNNYAYNNVSGTLTIDKAAILATAVDKTKVFGGPLPTFTLTYGGFVNSDDENDLNSLPTAVTSATSGSNVGTYDIDLIGGSDNNYTIGLAQGTLTIAKADQTITIDPIGDKLTTDVPFGISANSSSGLALDYGITGGPASVSGSTISLDGNSGTVVVNVSQAGNGNYNSSSESTSFIVSDPAKTNQTISFDAIGDKAFGDAAFTVVPSVTSGLNIDLSVVSGPITLSGDEVTITGVGTATIAANQAGDETYNPAMEVIITFTISKADQTISFEEISTKVFGESFNLEATVSSNLPLTYSVVSGSISISGTTVSIDGTGVATIAANQVGDENRLAALEVTRSFTIEKANQNITVTPIADKLITDDPFEIEATVVSNQPLTYEVEGPATISETTVTLTGSSGTVTITVDQVGNDNYNSASISTSFDVTDNQEAQAIAFSTISDQIFGSSLSLSASASSGLEVTFNVVSGSVTIDDDIVTITGTGSATITADQAGNENFHPAPQISQTFTISKANQAISLSEIENKFTTDEPFEVVASVDTEFALTYEIDGPATILENAITLNGTPGTVTVTVSQEGTENYSSVSSIISFEVTEKPLALGDEVFEIKFYPNPVTDFLIIESQRSISARLFNLHGKLIKQDLSQPGKIDMRILVPGVYLLEIVRGEQKVRRRIVKAN